MFIEKVMPRFSETDVLGHINNTALPIWFEAARTPFLNFYTRFKSEGLEADCR